MDVSTIIILSVVTSTVSIVSNLLLHLRIKSSCTDGCSVEPVRSTGDDGSESHVEEESNGNHVTINPFTQSHDSLHGNAVELSDLQPHELQYSVSHDKPPKHPPHRKSSVDTQGSSHSRRGSLSSVISDVVAGVVSDLSQVAIDAGNIDL